MTKKLHIWSDTMACWLPVIAQDTEKIYFMGVNGVKMYQLREDARLIYR